MSILIKGMEMPKSCYKCPMRRRDGMDIVCPLAHERFSVADVNILEYRLDNCPLVPVPPHGRLGDLDALLMRINHEVMEAYMDGVCYGVHPSQEYLYLLGEIIDDAPTIIPADEPKEET